MQFFDVCHFLVLEYKLTFLAGMTIGTSPWDESCKRRRTSLGYVLSRPAIQRSAPMIDVEARAVVEDMYAMSGGGQVDIEPSIFFKRAALNLTLEMCYGTRIESIDSPFFREMLQVVQNVSSYVVPITFCYFLTVQLMTSTASAPPTTIRRTMFRCFDIFLITGGGSWPRRCEKQEMVCWTLSFVPPRRL